MGQRIKVEMAPRPMLLASEPGGRLGGFEIVETTPGAPHAIIEVPDDWTPEQVEALAKDWEQRGLIVDDGRGLVRPEHTDYVPLGFSVPMETRSPSGVVTFQNPAYAPGDTFPLLGCTENVRRAGRYGAAIFVGVGDTGLDGNHPWGAGKGFRGDLTDQHGHGTHVAYTIAGAQGIASDAVIISKNVLPNGQGTESGVAAGIRALADAGCKVMNLSIGGSPSGTIDQAVEYAKQRGCLVIAAAGNSYSRDPNPGSPARSADMPVMSYKRDRTWSEFTDGRNWTMPDRGAGPGHDIVSAAPGGGTRQMSGTSMAAPHIAGAAALLMAAGMDREAAKRYLLEHRGHAPDGLACMLAADFGEVEQPPVPKPPPSTNETHALAVECVRVLDVSRFHTRRTDNEQAWNDVGAIATYLDRIAELTADPKVPEPGPIDPPPPPPPPVPALSFIGSYPTHDPAGDLYINGLCGPHLGFPLRAPAAGTVERYSFVTPLESEEYRIIHEDSDDWTAMQWSVAPAAVRELFSTPCADAVRMLGTQMHIAVWQGDEPLTLADGSTIRALWCGHVEAGIKTGRVAAGDVFAHSGQSGIEFPGGVEAAHVHVCGSRTGQLTPNGDVSGFLVARALGFQVRNVGRVPGPDEYQRGRGSAYRGHMGYAQWRAAGCG